MKGKLYTSQIVTCQRVTAFQVPGKKYTAGKSAQVRPVRSQHPELSVKVKEDIIMSGKKQALGDTGEVELVSSAPVTTKKNVASWVHLLAGA